MPYQAEYIWIDGTKPSPLLRNKTRIVADGKELKIDVPATKSVAHKDTTFLVTNMMRSVLNEGTAAGARGIS